MLGLAVSPLLAVFAAVDLAIAATPIISAVGSKFFTSSGDQFYIKGIAYQLIPNDPLIDTDQCKRDAKQMQDLGANAIRVYHVDPTADHKGCMDAFADVGIYLFVDLDDFPTQIQPTTPSWNPSQLAAFSAVLDEFQKYDNTAGVFVGNEVLTTGSTMTYHGGQEHRTDQLTAETSGAAPYVKAAVRDIKAYRDSKNYRKIPVGYSAADVPGLRPMLQNYLACGDNDAERAEFYSLNVYEWCGESSYDGSGYSQLEKNATGYNVPIFVSETGCREPRPRLFGDQASIFGQDMAGTWSGAIVYEWIQEANDYGLISYGPMVNPNVSTDALDGYPRSGTPTTVSPDYGNLKSQWATLSPSGEKLSVYSASASITPPACPTSTEGGWIVNGNAPLPSVGQTLDSAATASSAASTPTGSAAQASASATGGGATTGNKEITRMVIPTRSTFGAAHSSVASSVVPYAPPRLHNEIESPLLAPETKDDNSTAPMGLQKTNPSFHLLVPATESNSNLCKTLLSSFVLAYPPPTLINYGKKFDGDSWDKGTHTGKIRGVYDYLSNKDKVADDDMVLVIDGYDIWFQLPPVIMIKRYHQLVHEATVRLRRRYGTEPKEPEGAETRTEVAAKYSQSVVFGADKLCWPNSADDPACAAIPYSTLPKDAYGPLTDTDSEGFLNRPRFLNSGTVMGPVKDVRAIYEVAVRKVEEENRGTIGDQFVFAEIFGEQEYQRETQRQSTQGAGGRWYEWLSNALGASDSPLAANQTIKNMTVVPGRRYEFGIGLDYESKMFQTMTHSANDVEFITYNDTALFPGIIEKHPNLKQTPFALPVDIQKAHGPFWYSSPGNHSLEPKDSFLLPHSNYLDDLPERIDWYDAPLATNLYSPSVPTLLHINGDKAPLNDWWPSMWYHPYSRALVRRYIRSTQTRKAAQAAAAGGQTWWDMRGGRGGVWTDNAEWKSWNEVCKGTEEEVFGDGKGRWGKEEGSHKVTNYFGTVIIGDEDEDEG
ncbi:MAG: hypothetical protein Q9206_006233 [Seirophora lacunosa]